MKVIFLDIDGVLNSRRYDAERTDADGNIDISRLALLREIVQRTGAKLVLTSSWRSHWDPHGVNSDAVGDELAQLFRSNGVPLYDKTPSAQNNRLLEIAGWLIKHDDIEAFAVLDDMKFGWGLLAPFLVETDYNIGRGLEKRHVDRAVEILQGDS